MNKYIVDQTTGFCSVKQNEIDYGKDNKIYYIVHNILFLSLLCHFPFCDVLILEILFLVSTYLGGI